MLRLVPSSSAKIIEFPIRVQPAALDAEVQRLKAKADQALREYRQLKRAHLTIIK
jgi:hypothetical protein